jgi:ABC-2 type transport system ATP-binding protein
MIEAQNLCRRYGDFTAVDDVSFAMQEGEIVGILGPNGAGKTTTIRMITGFLPPSSGRVTVGGRDLFEEPRRARRDIGYLPERVALYEEMRVREYLAYRAGLEGLSRAEAREAIGDTVERCLLAEVENQVIRTLSKGYKQRVGLATAILHRPKVLVLDEPTVGLDPKQIIAIRELIRELGRAHTLLLSTHILPEVELLCDRVLIIDRGRLVAQGTPQGLRDLWLGHAAVRVVLKEVPENAAQRLAEIPGVVAVREDGARLRVEHETASDPREAIFRAAVAAGWTLLELASERVSLEDVFVRLTTQDTVAEEPEAGSAVAPASDDEDDQEVVS